MRISPRSRDKASHTCSRAYAIACSSLDPTLKLWSRAQTSLRCFSLRTGSHFRDATFAITWPPCRTKTALLQPWARTPPKRSLQAYFLFISETPRVARSKCMCTTRLSMIKTILLITSSALSNLERGKKIHSQWRNWASAKIRPHGPPNLATRALRAKLLWNPWQVPTWARYRSHSMTVKGSESLVAHQVSQHCAARLVIARSFWT
mmetsp:Transcript_39693/g.89222  ORF Transcript_39693/g.89222 Transcript_39693/m.89222 type:complete len:206 (+) Transcript_39693:55-672(+)